MTHDDRLLDILFDWLRPYQLALLRDQARYRIVLKSRQIGISDAIALEMVLVASGLMPGVLTHNAIVVSKTESDAMDVVDKSREWIRRLSLVPMLRPHLETSKDTAKEIKFALSGYRISSQAQSRDAGRGKTGHLYLDEFAFYVWQRDIWTGATPATESVEGLRITVVSTPNGTAEFFYELYNDQVKFGDWSRHRVDVHDAVRQGMPVDIDATRRKYTAQQWSQEFECSFLGSESNLFGLELLRESHVPKTPRGKVTRYVGIDTASVIDMTALVVLDEDADGKIWIGDAYYIENTPYRTDHVRGRVGQDVIVDTLLRYLGVDVATMDTTGDRARRARIGDGLYALLAPVVSSARLLPRTISREYKDGWTQKLLDALQIQDIVFDVRRRDYVYGPREAARFLDSAGGVPDQYISAFCLETFEETPFPMLFKDFQKVHRKWSGPNQVTIDTTRDETGHGDGYWAALIGYSAACEERERKAARARRDQTRSKIADTIKRSGAGARRRGGLYD